MITIEKNTFKMADQIKFIADYVLSILLEKTNAFKIDQDFSDSIYFQRLVNFIEKSEKIQIVLPAFPAKSPNREKTSGSLPDMGEVIALKNLNDICTKIANVYQPGVELIICSDGRVFSNLVQVSDEEINNYQKEIENIIKKFNYTHLKTFNLEDVYPDATFDEMRNILDENFSQPVSEIRENVKNDENAKRLFNGIHRFIFEDQLVLNKDSSKNSIRKNSKKIAYQVIQRSNAWSGVVEKHFPEAIRLSIHPHEIKSGKLGIQLVNCVDRWGTPWHNVALFDGINYNLVKRKDAIACGAKESTLNGYIFYASKNPKP